VKNSPVYYWLLSLFWFITRSAIGVGYFFALIGFLTVIFGYLLGEKIAGNKLGILLSLFIAISPFVIAASHNIWQAHLIPFFTIISMYTTILSIQKKKKILDFTLVIVLFFGIHIHLSFIPIFIVGSIWVFYIIFQYLLNKKNTQALMLAFHWLFQLFIFVQLTKGNINNYLTFFSTFVLDARKSNLLITLISRFEDAIRNTFARHGEINEYCLYIIFLSFIIILIYQLLKKKTRSNALIILSFFSSIIFTSFYHNPVNSELIWYYLNPYFICVLIISTYSISIIMDRNKYFALILIFGCIFLMIKCILGFGDLYFFTSTPLDEYGDSRNISKIIFDDLQRVNSSSFVLLICDNTPSFATASYYYFLETLFNKQLVFLTPSFNNTQPITINPKYIYLICIGDGANEKAYRDTWVNNISQDINLNTRFNGPELIDSYHNVRSYYFIYRFTRDQNMSSN